MDEDDDDGIFGGPIATSDEVRAMADEFRGPDFGILERMARAICVIETGGEVDPDALMAGGEAYWRDYYWTAVAALKAMMEPTPSMVSAAFEVADGQHHFGGADVVSCWQVMISAALAEVKSARLGSVADKWSAGRPADGRNK